MSLKYNTISISQKYKVMFLFFFQLYINSLYTLGLSPPNYLIYNGYYLLMGIKDFDYIRSHMKQVIRFKSTARVLMNSEI